MTMANRRLNANLASVTDALAGLTDAELHALIDRASVLIQQQHCSAQRMTQKPASEYRQVAA